MVQILFNFFRVIISFMLTYVYRSLFSVMFARIGAEVIVQYVAIQLPVKSKSAGCNEAEPFGLR